MVNRFKAAINSFVNPRDNERDFFKIGTSFNFGKQDQQKVSEGFQENNYVFSVVNRIAETGADIPILIYNTKADGTKELITDGEFYNFVNNPNKEDNYKTFMYKSLVYQLINGNSIKYIEIGIGSQVPDEIHLLAPQYIQIDSKETFSGYKPTKYNYKFGSNNYTFEVEEISHLKRFNNDPGSLNPCMGMSPLQAGYKVLVSSNKILEAQTSLMDNGGAKGFITSKSERPLTQEEKKMSEDAIKKRWGGSSKFGSIGVTSGNMDFISTAMSATDLKLLESGVLRLRDICSLYGANSRMFNDPQGASFNNKKQDDKDFIIKAVIPPLENELDLFNRDFTSKYNKAENKRYSVELDVSKIEALQEDQDKQIKKAKTKSQIISDIIKGIGTDWTQESAVIQMMDVLGYSRKDAEEMIDEPIKNEDEEIND